MMIIIDDDFRMSEKIKDELAAYQIKDVHTFTSTKDCSLEMIMKADLIFLDIEMPDENGLDFAKRIRKQDPNKKIIFISSHEEYVFDSFALQPFFFIRKTNLLADFKRAIETYLTIIENDQKLFIYKLGEQEYTLRRKSIIYFKKSTNIIQMHINDDRVIRLNESLKSIMDRLDDNFVLIDRSNIVNLYFLRDIEGIYAVLNTGEKLEISRRRKQNVKAALMDYIRRNNS